MMRLVVVGAGGRMGRAVVETAARDAGFELKAGVDVAARPPWWDDRVPWSQDLGSCLSAGDVVVEFSGSQGAVQAGQLCARRGAALVSGATGLSSDEERLIREASSKVAILRAANFSLGLLALRRGLRELLIALPGWDVEIVERHHRAKKDSPSGTALHLADDVAGLRGLPAPSLRHGREGSVGPRPADEIGLHAVRGGTWAGDHTVLLAGEGEWVELRHVAQDRSAFAHGALVAAGFVAKAPAGFYTLDAVTTIHPP